MLSGAQINPEYYALVLDWDGTMIAGSSLELIATIRPTAQLQGLVKAWEADYAQHERAYEAPRTTVKDEYTWLGSLATLEGASIRRMEDAGIWKDVTGPAVLADGGMRGDTSTRSNLKAGEDVRDTNEWSMPDPGSDVERSAVAAVRSRRVVLRPGVATLCRLALRHGHHVVVLSVAWSAAWIARCLVELGLPAQSYFTTRSHHDVQELKGSVVVIANEIDPLGSGRLTRTVTVEDLDRSSTSAKLTFESEGEGIWTSLHKQRLISRMFTPREKPYHMVYVGDSPTDLACLLEASCGICVYDTERTHEQQDLKGTLQRLGITVSSVNDYTTCEKVRTGLLSAENDFWGICRYLYGSDTISPEA